MQRPSRRTTRSGLRSIARPTLRPGRCWRRAGLFGRNRRRLPFMSLGRTNFDAISEADLADLIQAGVPEGLVIDYKRDPYGTSDGEKKEALKDITSFANSAGGHLIIGMDEASGVPTAPTGLPGVDPDALINRLESLVRDGVEPRIVGV